MNISEGYVNVTGGKVWYKKYDNRNEKAPVILLHGGPGSSHFSMQGLKELSSDRSVIFYDQLGCGKSDWPEDQSLWNLDRFVEELAQIRNRLALEKVHILGHSWGTTLAAAFYLLNPTGINSIIFSSPCLSAPLWAKDQEKNRKLLPKEIQSILTRCEKEGTTDSLEYKKATAEFNKRFVCRMDPIPEILIKGAAYRNPKVYQTMWGPSEFHVTGNLKAFDCTGRLKEFDVPSLFTCGRYDEATPETTAYFSKLAPKGKFHVFENSAHMPYLEEEKEYINVVNKFLNDND